MQVSSAESEIVTVDYQDDLTVLVSGYNLGHTSLTATASIPSPQTGASSRVITLVIGATFQVLTHGGPHYTSIVYSATGEEAGVVTSGLITGIKLEECSVVV